MPLVGGRRYFTSTAVFINEVLKLTLCYTVALYEISTASPSLPAFSLFANLTGAVFTGDSWKLAIPASLFVLQSSLQYVAISNLDSATFQITSQFKILPTAVLSVLLLKRSLSSRKWVALGLLMVGVAIVQIPNNDAPNPTPLKGTQSKFLFSRSLEALRNFGGSASTPLHKRSATYEGIQDDDMLAHPQMNAPLGLAAVLLGCTVSAAASVYFEKILKDSTIVKSLWIRNVQLAFYSLFPALFIGVVFVDGEQIAQHGFFVGYNWVVWITIVFQTTLGILVSLCVTYADNIAKNFAISISILISLCASVWFFNFAVSSNVRFAGAASRNLVDRKTIVSRGHIPRFFVDLSVQYSGLCTTATANSNTRLRKNYNRHPIGP